ncbi:MAG: hypothetical protein ACRCWM_05930 [Sarcina sp.]
MIKMNNQMENILQEIKKLNKDEVNITQLQEVLFPKITKVHDCFIIDNKSELDESKVKYDFIKRVFGDRTMYEISCNEVCINFYVEPNDNLLVAKVGFVVMEAWKYRLKSEYPKENFCIVMEVSDTHTILRFHKFKAEEGLVIGNDLGNSTDIAIAIEII